jgi:small subunit ribosomal protein S17
MPRRVEIGVVTSDKAGKTRRVEIPRLVRHPKYGKYLRRRTVCHVHDEKDESRQGDLVEIVESRPRSRLKRWELVRVVEKSRAIDLAAMRAGARGQIAEAGLEEGPGESAEAGPEMSLEEGPEGGAL